MEREELIVVVKVMVVVDDGKGRGKKNDVVMMTGGTLGLRCFGGLGVRHSFRSPK